MEMTRIALDAIEHHLGGAVLMRLTAGQKEAQRSLERVGEQVDLGRQSASGTPQCLVRAPLFGTAFAGGGLLVGSDEGGIGQAR